MSNTTYQQSFGQDVVPRLGDRPRDRRDRACRDPARRLPRPLPRTRRRRERPDAGARGEAAHPGGNAGHARRDQADVRSRRRSRARKSRSGRSPIRSTWPAARQPSRSSPASSSPRRDFAASDTASVDSQITGTQRAISISIDNVHGSLSQVQAGDSVDVYTAVAGDGEALPPERQGARDPVDAGPERRRQPRSSASRRRTRRRGPTRPTTRSSGSSSGRSSERSRRSRRPRNVGDGAEVGRDTTDAEPPGTSTPRRRAWRRRRGA